MTHPNTPLTLRSPNQPTNQQNVRYPEPFSSLLSAFSFLQFTFPFECVFPEDAGSASRFDYLAKVLTVSCVPLGLLLLNAAAYGYRRTAHSLHRLTAQRRRELERGWTMSRVRARTRASTLATMRLRGWSIAKNNNNNDNENNNNNKNNNAKASADASPVSPAGGLGPLTAGSSAAEADRLRKLANEHVYFALLLSYLVLPSASTAQFYALRCTEIGGGRRVLEIDTSVDCDSARYRHFVVFDVVLIVLYQSCPLIWLLILWEQRRLLNPNGNYGSSICSSSRKQGAAVSDDAANHNNNDDDGNPKDTEPGIVNRKAFVRHRSSALIVEDAPLLEGMVVPRSLDVRLEPSQFLWKDYTEKWYFFEVISMYVRLVFCAVLPVLTSAPSARVTVACLLAIVSVCFHREVSPFIVARNNVICVCSYYQILLTVFIALVIISETLDDFYGAVVGTTLFIVNVTAMALAVTWSLERFKTEEEQRGWRRQLSDNELEIVNRVMRMNSMASTSAALFGVGDGDDDDTNKSAGAMIEMTAPHRNQIRSSEENRGSLKQFLLHPSDIALGSKIGAGSFGEVFRGTCVGHPVAVKTLIDITEGSVAAFRDEVALTADLRHPNIGEHERG